MTKGGEVRRVHGEWGMGQRCKWSCQLLQLEPTSVARPIFVSCCHLNPRHPHTPHPTLRHFSLNFNYFHSLARAFLQLIKFFTLNFVYNCCWFALFVLLQLVFALLFLLLWCLLGTQNSPFNWMDTTRSALSTAWQVQSVPFVVPAWCCCCCWCCCCSCCCCCRLRLRAIWVSSGGSCVINGQIKWKPSEREIER